MEVYSLLKVASLRIRGSSKDLLDLFFAEKEFLEAVIFCLLFFCAKANTWELLSHCLFLISTNGYPKFSFELNILAKLKMIIHNWLILLSGSRKILDHSFMNLFKQKILLLVNELTGEIVLENSPTRLVLEFSKGNSVHDFYLTLKRRVADFFFFVRKVSVLVLIFFLCLIH